jgi:hypothetical protein
VYSTLCEASKDFESRVSSETWHERVEAAYKRYAAIQWSLLPEERKAELAAAQKAWWADLPEERKAELAAAQKAWWADLPEERKAELAAAHKAWWADLPEERKADIKTKISQAYAAKTEERKADIKTKMSQTCAARPEEVKVALSGKLKTIVSNHWSALSPEAKAARLKNFRAACPSSSKRGELSRAWWEKRDAAERKAFMQPLREGYKAKMTPQKQAETGRKRAAHYDAHPEKRQKAADNARRNIDQCMENFSHRKPLTEQQLKKRAETLSHTNQMKFVADINEKYEKLQEGQRLLHQERHALRASWNKAFKKANLGPEVAEKYRQLVMSDTEFAKSSGALGVLSPSTRVFVELIEKRFREVQEGSVPMTSSEARTLRRRMTRTFKSADLGPGVREKYAHLVSKKVA